MGATSPQRPPRRPLRALARALAWIVALLLLLLLLAFAFLQTELGRELVRDLALDALNGAVQGHVEVDRVSGLLPFDVRLEGVRIHDPDGVLTLAVAEVTADVHPLALLDTTVHLSDVRLVAPEVHLLDPRGEVALARAFAPRDPGPPDPTAPAWSVRLERIRLERGVIDQLTERPRLFFDDTTIDVSLHLGPRGLAWRDLVVTTHPDAPLPPLVVVRSDGELDGADLVLSRVEIDAPPHRVVLDGRLRLADLDAAEVHLTTVELDLDALPQALGPSPLAGTLELSGHASLDRGRLVAELAALTPAGALELQLGADTSARPVAWGGTVRFVGLRPGAFRDPMPAGFEADGSLTFSGAGSPLAPQRFHAAGELLERAPHPGGRLALEAERLPIDAADAAPGATGLYTFTVDADALVIDPWLAAFGQPDLTARLTRLAAGGQLILARGERPKVVLGVDFDVSARGRLAGRVEDLDVPQAFGGAELQWGGEGVPVGSVALTVADGRFGAQTLAFADVSGRLGRDARDAPSFEGVLRLQDAVLGPDLAAARLAVPFDLVAPDTEGPPTGHFDIDGGGLVVGGQALAQLTGRFALGRAAHGVTVDGQFEAGGVATSDGARATSARGRVDTWIGWRGQVDGTAEVTLEGASAFGVSARRVHADARIGARQGFGATATLAGAYDAEGVTLRGVTLGIAQGDFDLTLDRGSPTGGVRARVREAVVVPCVGDRGCAVAEMSVDAQVQGGGKVAWDVRARQGGLELSLLGVAQLPLAGRVLQVDLDRLALVRAPASGARREGLVLAEQVRWVAGGLVRLGKLEIEAPRGATGSISALGTVDPMGGTLDVVVSAQRLGVAGWLERGAAIAEGVLAPVAEGANAGPNPFAAGLPDIDGEITLEGTLRGAFSAPAATLVVSLAEGRLGELRGLALEGTLDWSAGLLSLGRLEGQWHDGGRFSGQAEVPGTLSLAPPGVTWATERPLELVFSAEDADLEATQRFLAGVGAGDRLEGKALAGRAQLAVLAEGPLGHPTVTLDARGEPFSIGAYRDGKVSLGVTSAGGKTELTFDLDGPPRAFPPARGGATAPRWPSRKPLVDLSATLPLDVGELLGAHHPLVLVRERLRDAPAERCRLDLQAGRMTLAETPLEPFLSRSQKALEVVAQLHLVGPFSHLDVSRSRVEVSGLRNGTASVVAWLRAVDNTLSAEATVTLERGRALRGSFAVPDVGLLAVEPGQLDRLVRDPRLRVAAFTDDMTSGELWGFHAGLGEVAATFLPDARAMVHVNAHGGPAGPVANVLVRLRNARRALRRGDDLDRNVADDLRATVRMDPEATELTLRITQDAPEPEPPDADRPDAALALRAGSHTTAPSPANACRLTAAGETATSLAFLARAETGTRALLAGELPALEAVPLDARIDACGLELGRVTRALGATFGPSRGRLDGRARLVGTLAAPDLSGDLVFDFEQLAIDTIGFHRDRLAVGVHLAGRTISLVPIHLEALPSSKDGAAPPATFDLAFAATLERLGARGVRFDGRLTMKDFPLLDTRDAKARVAADLTFGGHAARPEVRGRVEILSGLYQRDFGGRSVRPLGLPEDVTLVSGDPVPPEDVVSDRRRFATGAKIDVAVEIREGRVVIANEMMRLAPWTRDLHVRTNDGELAITGTIFVPKEKITLYGKTFRLADDSRIVFTGDMTTDPQLLIAATYDISEVDLGPIGLVATPESRAKVAITGNATAPKLTLSSDPPMDESNIINVIVFDAPIGQGDSQDTAVRNQVANLVIGLATGSLSRFVTEQLPIDTFQLDTKTGDLTESRLTLGKRLAKNLFFRYRRNIGADGESESANEFSAEYRLGPMTFLGNYGDIGEFSLEANLRLHD